MAAGCGIPTGREYIDFMCSWGPVMRGHHDADVDAAAAAQARAGDVMNGPAPVLVELAEFFTALVAHADWALFAKNGTDATTIGVTTARAATRKRKLLLARGACHGAARARGCGVDLRHRLVLVRRRGHGLGTGHFAQAAGAGRHHPHSGDGSAAARWPGRAGEGHGFGIRQSDPPQTGA
ncbi:MAG TPA: aminotransferase class III-fold pyridoxal phosphate-dependent enzyme [Burkholderiaceae bacterium]|nr:aminotransferase class III-fold pyridoxal phosphate-dependent enzyme [Burkholderiaceae bacterium]